jgi:hypothetical protein
VNYKAAVAEERAHAVFEGDVWIGEGSHVGCAICFAVFSTEVTDLAGFWARCGAWLDFAANEGVEMGKGRVAVAVGSDGANVDVKGWLG